RRVRVVRGIRDAQGQRRAAMLPDELALEREREGPGARLDEDVLAPHRLGAVQSAREVDAHDVTGLDDGTVLHRAELRHGVAQAAIAVDGRETVSPPRSPRAISGRTSTLAE